MKEKPSIRCNGDRELVATMQSGGKKTAKAYCFDSVFDENTSQVRDLGFKKIGEAGAGESGL